MYRLPDKLTLTGKMYLQQQVSLVYTSINYLLHNYTDERKTEVRGQMNGHKDGQTDKMYKIIRQTDRRVGGQTGSWVDMHVYTCM